ncbi:MAG: MFS transporter [Opitutaceae bacterium]|nr:MFS transporter [Opitutaceae bacterium]
MSSTTAPTPAAADSGALRVLVALSVAHLLNDVLQALIPALYPLIKDTFALSFAQIGLITFTYQLTASVLQPLVGAFTDRRPLPQSLAGGMVFTLVGLVLFARATQYSTLVVAAGLTGTGSAIFHPEASRLARLASGGRHGFAQALFQVGGNLGSSIGPLFIALIVAPRGQAHLLWSTVLALGAIVLLVRLGDWYRQHLNDVRRRSPAAALRPPPGPLPRGRVALVLGVLGVLILSKYFYLAAMTSYYTFYLIARFGVSVPAAQVYLFVFLFAVAAGTIIGGPVGDRIGRRKVIWASILGVAPFTLALPYTGLAGTVALSVVIGVVLASAFSAILVYAQELLPGRVGFVAGLFFGLAFGMAGIGSALLGRLADLTNIEYVFRVAGYLPLLGLLAVCLPDLRHEAAPGA